MPPRTPRAKPKTKLHGLASSEKPISGPNMMPAPPIMAQIAPMVSFFLVSSDESFLTIIWNEMGTLIYYVFVVERFEIGLFAHPRAGIFLRTMSASIFSGQKR